MTNPIYYFFYKVLFCILYILGSNSYLGYIEAKFSCVH